ncbi:hypothetical protein SAMN05216600_10245 [Pseudomonas cuatrocienegasensis]|uniref:Vitamin K epoxide reductase family protein n=1 Tax=Pseudomonas cuatrocienegasensis TaxID=543360 RepID=A0ABY1B3K9_9PSED|nr:MULTISPECIES: hypothetical protein [Pseudomonas]OEC37092.1 hypothetical protein A7D25_00015 [Pseudomonas sp. 21C1]SEP85229.1 hypothetical protein SAMN05216600_10245 [Pseudomonas cuatrocienegasensis]
MSRRLSLILLSVAVALCLAASYGLRYGLMEEDRWVGLCVTDPATLACQVRATFGWLIHLRVLAWTALVLAVLAFVLPGRLGRALAVPALLASLPAMVLYTASMAVFAVVLALLRLVRAPRVQA